MLFDAKLPLELAKTIPSDWYTDAGMASIERESIFARSWLCVGRVDAVEKSGEFFTFDIAGESLLIIRGDDGVLRGFFNVCRHRAAPILTDAQGCVNKLRCHYHGWTYDLAGRLKGTPEFEGVCDFDKETNGLVPVAAIEVFGPFVWVSLEKPNSSLTDWLNPLPDFFTTHQPFHNLQFHSRVAYDLNCNWKVYVDNYLDGGYHVNTVHPALAGVLDYREYKTTTHGKTVLQSSPLKPAEGDAGRVRTGSDAAYWWIFPNVMINTYSGIADVNTVLPLGPDRCRVLFDYYFQSGTSEEFCRESIAVADQVQREDIEISEQVQKNLSSRSYAAGRFSVKRENGGYHFHQLLAAMLS